MAFVNSFVPSASVVRDLRMRSHLQKCGFQRRNTIHCCQLAQTQRGVPLLEMRDISFEIPRNEDVKLFTNMNFKIHPGEFVVIIGQNGAGKTTALNIMIGLLTVRRGRGDIFWRGQKMKPSNLMGNIGVVMQNPANYFFTPTVLDELVLGREKNPDDVRRVMHAVGLRDVSLVANPASLSGGQVRRLAIASQLMREPLPALFVLDEPLAGVDWTARRDLVELLGSLKSQFSIIIVSHEPDDLLDFADRVVEVRKGGMHDIDPAIIQRAGVVRRRRRVEMRNRAIEEAELYRRAQAETKGEGPTALPLE